jgi:hypothetical protein
MRALLEALSEMKSTPLDHLFTRVLQRRWPIGVSVRETPNADR